tara:strand:+ start:163 stop:537 length:375 start_codon:yes stop_codon:yes gene_type:complete
MDAVIDNAEHEGSLQYKIGDSYSTFLLRNGLPPSDDNGRAFKAAQRAAFKASKEEREERKAKFAKAGKKAVFTKYGWQVRFTEQYELMAEEEKDGQLVHDAIEKTKTKSAERIEKMVSASMQLL